MARLDLILFGYREITVSSEDAPVLAGVLLRLGINADVDPRGTALIRERDIARFIPFAKRKIRFTMSETRGFLGFLKANRKRYGVFAAATVILALVIFLSNLVWDIRISGNSTIPDERIISELAECGFEVGSLWSTTDKNKVEIRILSTDKDIAWISVNRRGTVAHVEIMEAENSNIQKEEPVGYCNVVSDRDAVIEEITVTSGVAVVKVGDVVKRGDVLISGVVETERGVTLCHAEGRVVGQSRTELSAEISATAVLNVPEEPVLCEIKINIFKISANIFKNYRNRKEGCDIIYDVKEYTLSGDSKLPVSLTRVYARNYSEVTVTRTEDEMVSIAAQELNAKLASELADADVLKLRTYGSFTEEGYILTTEVVYSASIGTDSAIETD